MTEMATSCKVMLSTAFQIWYHIALNIVAFVQLLLSMRPCSEKSFYRAIYCLGTMSVKLPFKASSEIVNFNIKFRRIINGGNLVVRLLTWDH
jgi:hypothetical protein